MAPILAYSSLESISTFNYCFGRRSDESPVSSLFSDGILSKLFFSYYPEFSGFNGTFAYPICPAAYGMLNFLPAEDAESLLSILDGFRDALTAIEETGADPEAGEEDYEKCALNEWLATIKGALEDTSGISLITPEKATEYRVRSLKAGRPAHGIYHGVRGGHGANQGGES